MSGVPSTSAKQPRGTDNKQFGKWSAFMLLIACIPLIMQLGMLIAYTISPLQPFPASEGQSSSGVADASKLGDSSLAVQSFSGDQEDCIISFSDIHGDLHQARAALKLAGVSNETHLWTAGNCTFIQTGDLVDRGPNSIEVVQLFEDVKKAAEAGGGRFIGLLGNHEMMNLQVRSSFRLDVPCVVCNSSQRHCQCYRESCCHNIYTGVHSHGYTCSHQD